MTGYKAVAHARPEPNRGSVIWVRECYLNQMVRVYDPEDKDIGSEVIHLLMDRMDTLPPTNIICVYQETGKGKDEIEFEFFLIINICFNFSRNELKTVKSPICRLTSN